MIAECKRCGDPLFPYMERCSGCGADNPGFVTREPPRNNVYRTDEGTEWGLFAMGLAGLVAGGKLVGGASRVPLLAPWLAVLCAATGLISLVAFRRLTVSDLSPRAKTALRAAMFASGGLYALAYTIAR